MDLLSLVAKLTLDSSQYNQGLSDAESDAVSFGDKLKAGLDAAASVGISAVTAVADAAKTMTTALINNAGDVAAYGDNIDKASQKIGFSAEAYQEWDAVLQHSGTSISSLTPAIKTLSAKAQDGSDAFKALGISEKEAASMSREQLFERTITALQGVSDETKRAALAQELLGKGAMELGPLLNTSASDTQAMRDRVHELGGVMSDEAVKASAAYQDSLQDMTTAMDGMKRNIIAEFLPSITTVMDGLTEIFSGNDDEGLGKIYDGIDLFVENLNEVLPRIMEVGSNIILSLGTAIVENVPYLLGTAAETVITLAQGILENMDMLADVAVDLVVGLSTSISEALPKLIPAAVDAIIQIADTLTDPDYLSMLIDAAIRIIMALIEGLTEAIPHLIEAAPTIVANLVTALIENAPKILEASIKLVVTLAQGILDSASKVDEAIGDIINIIIDAISDVINKALTWGKELLNNFGDGIGKQAGEALKSVKDFVTDIWNNGFKSIVDGALNWGSDMISNFTNGIKNMAGNAVDAVKGLAGRIAGFLHFSEPDEGPLSNFHTYAPDMMKLFAEGIQKNEHLITDAVSDVFDLQPIITSTATYNSTNDAIKPQMFSIPRNTDRPINIIFEVDGVQKLIYRLNKAEEQRIGLKLNGGMI